MSFSFRLIQEIPRVSHSWVSLFEPTLVLGIRFLFFLKVRLIANCRSCSVIRSMLMAASGSSRRNVLLHTVRVKGISLTSRPVRKRRLMLIRHSRVSYIFASFLSSPSFSLIFFLCVSNGHIHSHCSMCVESRGVWRVQRRFQWSYQHPSRQWSRQLRLLREGWSHCCHLFTSRHYLHLLNLSMRSFFLRHDCNASPFLFCPITTSDSAISMHF